MANHKSSIKRVRQDNKKRLHNKYYARSTRNAIRKIKGMDSKEEAVVLLPKVTAMLDKLAKINVIHKNKAANIKSSITKHVNSLA